MAIHPANARDAVRLAALHAESLPPGWSEEEMRTLFDVPGTFGFLSGNGMILARVAGDQADLLTFAVQPAARRQGQGRALLSAALAKSRELGAGKMFLEVAEANEAAITLYEKCGFFVLTRRRGYYSPGADALLMRIDLK